MRWCLLLLVLFFVPLVSAGLIVSPQRNSLEVFRGVQESFSLDLFNNNSFDVVNVSFSNVSNFRFPVVLGLSAGESRSVSFDVLSQDLFSSSFVSTLSYFYLVPFNPSPVTVVVNISQGGFSPSSFVLMRGDSVQWRNLLAQDVVVRDFLGSGFSDVSIPALQSRSVVYNSLGVFAFYNNVLGYSGSLSVVERSNSSFAHDSSLDVPVYFNLRSVLPDNTLSVSLVGSLSANNNQSVTGYLSVTNNDQSVVVSGIHLSADRWVSNFSDNDFNLVPSTPSFVSSRVVSFIINPLVFRSNDTNRSHNVSIIVSSLNAGNISRNIPVFVNFANLDVVNIGGVNYTITILGVQETIQACMQHFGETGFESCRDLKSWARENVTLVVEVPAQYKFSEKDLVDIKAQLKVFGDSALRTENKNNLFFATQDEINNMTLHNSLEISSINESVGVFLVKYSDELRRINIRYWISLSLIIMALLLGFISWFISGVLYYNALVEAFQT